MEESEKREQLRSDLDRVNFWISNADQKAGILLAVIGFVVPVVGSTDKVVEIVASAIKPLLDAFKNNAPLPCYNIIYCLLILACIILVGITVYYLIKTITAEINPRIFKEKELNVNSQLHFQTINKKSFSVFRNSRMCQMESLEQESVDYLSQIYINSDICTTKFLNYNQGIKYLKWFLVSFVVTSIVLTINYIAVFSVNP